MVLPAGDHELVQIVDAALADVVHRAGSQLACRPGCTQCCHGAFSIHALDVARLREGMATLGRDQPALAADLESRARAWLAKHGPNFPGDPQTGILGQSLEDQARFDDFANDAPCPALDPATGLCDVYAWRPMTCRVFGPPTRPEPEGPIGCCDLCFIEATDDEIAACEMPVPHQLEQRLLQQVGPSGETVVAFALLP
ncbi:MAG TPA: YkgJ family cysteine cluster protein [Terracidiphilus sp.]|nr:YkgJ family cysteine cluster protein [Terracidiphilus sp.]